MYSLNCDGIDCGQGRHFHGRNTSSDCHYKVLPIVSICMMLTLFEILFTEIEGNPPSSSSETAPLLRRKSTGSGRRGSRRNEIVRNINGHFLELPKSSEPKGLSGEKEQPMHEHLQTYHQLLRKRR